MIVALDFYGAGDGADFAFLGDSANAPTVVRIDPVADLHAGESPDDHAARILAELPWRPVSVLAYCATAALGIRLASAAGATTILVDPDPVTPAYLDTEFATLYSTLGFDPQPVLERVDLPRYERYEQALTSVAASVAEAFGGDEDARAMVEDLLTRYRSWLRYLDVNVVPAVEILGELTVVTGRPDPDLKQLITNAERAEICFLPTDGGPTLRDPAVREVVRALVAATGRSSAGRPG